MSPLSFIQVRRPKLALALIGVITIGAAVLGSGTASRLGASENELLSHGTESFKTASLLRHTIGAEAFPEIVVLLPVHGRQRATVVSKLQAVVKLVSGEFPSKDGRTIALLGRFKRAQDAGPAAVRLAEQLDRLPGVLVGGAALAHQEFKEQVAHNLLIGEVLALPLLLLMAVVVFRGIVAAALPICVGGISLAITLLGLRLVNEFHPLSIWSLNLAAALAVGLSIDYSLLLVSRYREELGGGRLPQSAAAATMNSAGKTVAFSATTVGASFGALLIFPMDLLRSMAVGGMMVAGVAGAVALIVLPAVFALLGPRVNALAPRSWRTRPPERATTKWYRLARFSTSRPRRVAFASIALLALLAVPAAGMRLTGLDETALAKGTNTGVFTKRVETKFAHPLINEIEVAARGSEQTINGLVRKLEKMPGIRSGYVGSVREGLWKLDIRSKSDPFSDATKTLVERIRALPYNLGVTGVTASYLDTVAVFRSRLPIVLLMLFSITLVLVYAATKSLILPLKAVVLNLITLAATFGVVVWVFQDGRFESLFGYHGEGALVLPIPVLVAAGTFGILTDYGIFLLRRIREEWEAGRPNIDAIAFGLERTGRIVTSAAVLFCFAVIPLLLAKVTFIKEAGFAAIVAVVLDASVVRAFLVPSLMVMLGKWNWWRPAFLRRDVVPHVSRRYGGSP